MELTITFGAWVIPAVITLISIVWAMWPDYGDGMLAGIGNVILLVPALFVSMLSWIVYAIFK